MTDMGDISERAINFAKIENEGTEFYEKAQDYWKKIPPTIDGVLGGFADISTLDVSSSVMFLQDIFQFKKAPGHKRALDCGAGIGRITQRLLLKQFGKIDLVEPTKHFIDKSKEIFKDSAKIGEYYNCALQNFESEYKYDIIWCQWVLGHLTNNDLVTFFKKISENNLTENGVIVVKENISQKSIELDQVDSSLTRPRPEFLEIFQISNLRLLKEVIQKNFPDQLYEVRMFALRPTNKKI